MSKKRICITGITGHIGNALALFLQEGGYEVIGFAHNNTAENNAIFSLLKMPARYGDICDLALLKRLFQGADTVIHCAAEVNISSNKSSERIEQTNVEGTRAVVAAAAAAKVRHVVYLSSIHAFNYNAKSRVVNEELTLATEHTVAYNRSKARATRYILQQNEIAHVTALAPTGVIGPYDNKPSAMGEVIIRIAHNRQPFLLQGGFDWVDVRDLCETISAVIEKPQKRDLYLISGHFVTLKEIAHMIGALEEKKIAAVALPLAVAYIGVPFARLYATLSRTSPKITRETLVHLSESNRRVSSAKARRDFAHSIRPFVDTLSDTLAWFRQQGMLARGSASTQSAQGSTSAQRG